MKLIEKYIYFILLILIILITILVYIVYRDHLTYYKDIEYFSVV
mgnify:CR=1 FL=1|jgi:hypothetical protein